MADLNYTAAQINSILGQQVDVTELPATGTAGVIYQLAAGYYSLAGTANDYIYPPGLYTYNGSEWKCIASGGTYRVTLTGEYEGTIYFPGGTVYIQLGGDSTITPSPASKKTLLTINTYDGVSDVYSLVFYAAYASVTGDIQTHMLTGETFLDGYAIAVTLANYDAS